MRAASMPDMEVRNAVLSPLRSIGTLAEIFPTSNLISPINIPRNVPKIPRVVVSPDIEAMSCFLLKYKGLRRISNENPTEK
jgi:hypothetical protein